MNRDPMPMPRFTVASTAPKSCRHLMLGMDVASMLTTVELVIEERHDVPLHALEAVRDRLSATIVAKRGTSADQVALTRQG